jgi:multidrug resistance protein
MPFLKARKLHIVVAGIYFVFNSSLGSSLPSGAHDAIADYFQIAKDDLKMVLPTSLYMAGFAIGPLMFGPLSERFGRRPILVATFAIYNIFTMACALSPTFPALLVFRFLCGLGGSAPNAVLGGLFSDIYNDPHQRGMVMSIFMFATTFPPLLGPIISGFVSAVSWRWTFWAGFIIGGVGFPLVLAIPETYMPVLLRAHEQALSKYYIDSEATKSCLSERRSADSTVRILCRPFSMIAQEPIVFCCSMYLALIYSLLYLFFQAYPLVFQGMSASLSLSGIISNRRFLIQGLYGVSPGVAGLAFLPSTFNISVFCHAQALQILQFCPDQFLPLPYFSGIAHIIPKL